MILLKDVLKELGLNLDQLIILAILIGTDYNPGGIKGIGPKKALKLVKENQDFEQIFKEVNWQEFYLDLDWREIFNTIKNMPVTDDYNLKWQPVDEETLVKLLVKIHDFNEERVRSKLERLRKENRKLEQKGLNLFFK